MTNNPHDVRVDAVTLYFLPITLRTPLRFGAMTMDRVTCARALVTVRDARGRQASGWGETPLSVQWVWPSAEPYDAREAALKMFCAALAGALSRLELAGHPLELTQAFQRDILPSLRDGFHPPQVNEPLPYLAALLCLSAFDIAMHDAYGTLHACDVYQTYNARFMSRDLAAYLTPSEESEGEVCFKGRYVEDFLVPDPAERLPAWHLVGGLDPLEAADLQGDEPQDEHPILLRDWIARDGLRCLKVKLRGTDPAWDYDRLVRVGQIARAESGSCLSADFNCTVTEIGYVTEVLDRLRRDEPAIHDMLLYVEQPFPSDLQSHPLDVREVARRKPLLLDESAHDWRFVRLGRSLGWSGVALKTCKTQSGALLSLCWAKAHGMPLMVQDLTNPMLAQIPHLRLAAHAGTLRGVETNSMQYYPDASLPEARVHPGLFRRRGGAVDLATLSGPGFGYRVREIGRELPAPAIEFSR